VGADDVQGRRVKRWLAATCELGPDLSYPSSSALTRGGCWPVVTLLSFPSPTSSSFLQELDVRGPATAVVAMRTMRCRERHRELFYFCFSGVKLETRLCAHLRLQCNPRHGVGDV
jgi:hypothetical protein